MSQNTLLRVVALAATAAVLILVPSRGSADETAKRKTDPLPLIFDTDLGNDVDDALALGMIHALQSRGECELKAVTITKSNSLAAALTDAINTFYGRGEVAIGVTRRQVTPETGKFLGLATARDEGELRYPRDLDSKAEVPDAVDILRRQLAASADRSVVIVQVGFSTNLADLLESTPDSVSPLPGPQLVRRKVKRLSVMAGAFAPINGKPHREYNVVKDIPAAQKLARDWPTSLVYSGFEIGLALRYPHQSIELDYGYVEHHPLAESYRLYCKPQEDRPTWDLTSVLVAVRPRHGYFQLSQPGTVTVDDNGLTQFKSSPNGRHRYLKLPTPTGRARVTEALVMLSSQPPG